MAKKKAEIARPDVQVKIKLLTYRCGRLTIQTKYGQYALMSEIPRTMSKEEAEELIKVRRYQLRNDPVENDLVIVEDAG